MAIIDINTLKVNDLIKFIGPNKTLVDGTIKKISNDCLGITINTRQGAFMVLNNGQSVTLILIHELEALKCSAVVLGCIQNDFEQAIIITIPELVLSVERREFERIPIVMDMEYAPLPIGAYYQNLGNIEPKYFRSLKKTYTINLSGGGVYFIVSKNEIDNKFALVSLSLENENIVTLCEKIRTDPADDFKHHKVAYKFNDIKSHHRQLILDFVSKKSK